VSIALVFLNSPITFNHLEIAGTRIYGKPNSTKGTRTDAYIRAKKIDYFLSERAGRQRSLEKILAESLNNN